MEGHGKQIGLLKDLWTLGAKSVMYLLSLVVKNLFWHVCLK